MKKIYLTQGQVSLVDDEDYENLNKTKWSASWETHTKSYRATSNKRSVNGKRGTIFLHRVVTNAPSGMVVDHINHDSLDNRKQNLRVCSNAENVRNRKIPSNNKTGYKGVSWDKESRKYLVQVSIRGFPKKVGRFKDIKEAALAYNRACQTLYGDFALANKI